MVNTPGRDHWEEIWSSREPDTLSWYQAPEAVSAIVAEIVAALPPPASVVDVGGGASTLVDSLIDAGYLDLTVVDLASAALHRSQQRMGGRAPSVRWVSADVTTWEPGRTFDVWHDRAVFHFLTDAADQQRYVQTATAAVRPGGRLFLRTFALDGPERCSGLLVERYDGAALAERFSEGFVLVASVASDHLTPGGAAQRFTAVELARR